MKNFFKSFLFAGKGILAGLHEQRNLKVQTLVGLIAVGASFYFDITPMEWCLVLFSIGLVLSLELMNTAIEDAVDLVTSEWKPLAGKIKDMAAAAVLVASIITVIIGVIIFRKYLMV
jgi:diacylglycerol kinase